MGPGLESCLKHESLAAFASGLLAGSDVVRLEAHVARCAECRVLLSALARSKGDDSSPGESLPVSSVPPAWVAATFDSVHATLPRFSADARGDAEPGTRVGRYFLLRPLGAGGMGVVYEAYDPELDRKVAIKILRVEVDAGSPGDARVPALQARLQREARVMARLAHPNVVAVYDAGAFGDRTFVAMELVVGQTLTRWLAAERRSTAEIVRVFLAAGRGLAAAHSAGIIHRDFKPENVLLGDDGRVRVSDFGLAQPALAGTHASPSLDGVAGTPYYMAPEQLAGKIVDARADQFSFCVALVDALTGEHPTAAAGAKMERRRGRHERIPARLWPAIRAGLAPSPEDRHPSMAALLKALASGSRGRWRHSVVVASALSVLIAGATLTLRPAASENPCRGVAGELASIWNGDRARAVGRALTGVGGNGKALAGDLVRSLDGYARSWISMRTEVCEAGRIRGAQPTAVLAARAGCLDARARELEHLVDRLTGPDAALVHDAPAAVQALGPLGACADSERLVGAVEVSSQPSIAAILDAGGRPTIFVRQADGWLWQIREDSPGSWRALRLVDQAIGRPDALVVGASLLHVVRRSDGSLWRGLPARREGSAGDGSPIMTELAGDPGLLLIHGAPVTFARKTDGWMWRGGAGRLAGARPAGQRVAPLVSGSPALWLDERNQPTYLARRPDGSLWLGWQRELTAPWQEQKLAEQIAGDPQVALDAIGQLTYFARRSDGVLSHGYQAGAGSASWESVALVDGVAGDPSVVLDAERQINVFSRRPDGSLWHGWQDGPGRGPWHDATIASGLTGDPAALLTSDGRLMVFAGKADGSIWQGVQAGPDGAWLERTIAVSEVPR